MDILRISFYILNLKFYRYDFCTIPISFYRNFFESLFRSLLYITFIENKYCVHSC